MGFHTRFRDVARGGIRLVLSRDKTTYERNFATLFDEPGPPRQRFPTPVKEFVVFQAEVGSQPSTAASRRLRTPWTCKVPITMATSMSFTVGSTKIRGTVQVQVPPFHNKTPRSGVLQPGFHSAVQEQGWGSGQG